MPRTLFQTCDLLCAIHKLKMKRKSIQTFVCGKLFYFNRIQILFVMYDNGEQCAYVFAFACLSFHFSHTKVQIKPDLYLHWKLHGIKVKHLNIQVNWEFTRSEMECMVCKWFCIRKTSFFLYIVNGFTVSTKRRTVAHLIGIYIDIYRIESLLSRVFPYMYIVSSKGGNQKYFE